MEGIPLIGHRARPTQAPTQVVQIATWQENDEIEIFPVGSKPKRYVLAPDEPAEPFIIPKHNYLFKISDGFRRHQLWSEIIAYELGRRCGIDVPPCFVAFDASRGQAGVLMEFFFGYPGTLAPRFVHGTDPNQRHFEDYGQKSGRPHSVRRNLQICRLYRVANAVDWWARTLAFDALIGNVDRHAQNWGLLRDATNADVYRLAPAFDNGTSLGYECLDDALARASTPEQIARHLRRGTHHCTWNDSQERHGDPMFELCGRLYTAYPSARQAMLDVIRLTDDQIDSACNRCVDFDIPVKFIESRASYVGGLVRARRDALTQTFGV
jgi:hypothetical protein